MKLQEEGVPKRHPSTNEKARGLEPVKVHEINDKKDSQKSNVVDRNSGKLSAAANPKSFSQSSSFTQDMKNRNSVTEGVPDIQFSLSGDHENSEKIKMDFLSVLGDRVASYSSQIFASESNIDRKEYAKELMDTLETLKLSIKKESYLLGQINQYEAKMKEQEREIQKLSHGGESAAKPIKIELKSSKLDKMNSLLNSQSDDVKNLANQIKLTNESNELSNLLSQLNEVNESMRLKEIAFQNQQLRIETLEDQVQRQEEELETYRKHQSAAKSGFESQKMVEPAIFLELQSKASALQRENDELKKDNEKLTGYVSQHDQILQMEKDKTEKELNSLKA